MAENLEPPKPMYTFSIQCDVLPILKLARWSVQASEFILEVHERRQALPEFDQAFRRMLPGVCTPDTLSNNELVAGALYTAECMLEMFTDAHGGDI